MKGKLLIVIMSLLVATHMSAQENMTRQQKKEARELAKQKRKQMQERMDSLMYEEAVKAIADTAFTLEADEVVFKYGQTAHVSSNTNFVAVNKDEAVVQVAFNVPFAGPNGIGGVTVSGRVSGYKVDADKDGNTIIEAYVQGAGISARITINLWKGSNQAMVNISPNFNSRRITLNGVLVPEANSNVYQGRTW